MYIRTIPDKFHKFSRGKKEKKRYDTEEPKNEVQGGEGMEKFFMFCTCLL